VISTAQDGMTFPYNCFARMQIIYQYGKCTFLEQVDLTGNYIICFSENREIAFRMQRLWQNSQTDALNSLNLTLGALS